MSSNQDSRSRTTPDIDDEESPRSSSPSQKTPSGSSFEQIKELEKLNKIIESKKKAGIPYEKEKRKYQTVNHMIDLRTLQKKHLANINTLSNKDEVLEKIIKTEEHAETYIEKFIKNDISPAEFTDRAKSTISKLQTLLERLPVDGKKKRDKPPKKGTKLVSLKEATKKIMAKRDIAGKLQIPKLITEDEKKQLYKKPSEDYDGMSLDDKPNAKPVIGSPSKSPPKNKTTLKLKKEAPKIKIIKKKKTRPHQKRKAGKKIDTFVRDGKPKTIARGARSPPKIKTSDRDAFLEDEKDLTFLPVEDEGANPTLIKKTRPDKKIPTAGRLVPIRDINNMSKNELVKLFRKEGLEFPKGQGKIKKKDGVKLVRKLLKEHYAKMKPKRKVKVLSPVKTTAAYWRPPMAVTGDLVYLDGIPKRIRKPSDSPKRKTVKTIPVPRKLKKKAPKRISVPKPGSPGKKRILTDEMFDPNHPKYFTGKKVKGVGWVGAPRIKQYREINLDTGKMEWDPRPSWEYVPDGSPENNKIYKKIKADLIKAVVKTTPGNQFLMACTIFDAHRILQMRRAQLNKIKDPAKRVPLGNKITTYLNNLSKKSSSGKQLSNPTSTAKQPLLLTMDGITRPTLRKKKKGETAASPKKITKKIIKKIPVEVLNYPIPAWYARVDFMEAPPSFYLNKEGSKSSEKKLAQQAIKNKKPVLRQIVTKTPNWRDVEASGFVIKTGNTITREVTTEDLERYLEKTYLMGFDNYHRGVIKIQAEDRAYAFRRGIDLRKIVGTNLSRERGDYIITREDLQKTKKLSPFAVEGKETGTEKEKKAVEAAFNSAKLLYSVFQKHQPKVILKKHGKQKIAQVQTNMTLEQYEEAIKGKKDFEVPMTTEQNSKTIKKIQENLKELLALEAGLSKDSTEAKEKVGAAITNVTKFLENMKKKNIIPPDKTKRKGPAKKSVATKYLKIKKKAPVKSPSKSSSKDSSSSKKTVAEAASSKKSPSKTPPATATPTKKKTPTKSSSKDSSTKSSRDSLSLDEEAFIKELEADLAIKDWKEKKDEHVGEDMRESPRVMWENMIRANEEDKAYRAQLAAETGEPMERLFPPAVDVSRPVQ